MFSFLTILKQSRVLFHQRFIPSRSFAGRIVKRGTGKSLKSPPVPKDPWQEVKDPSSGLTYWWNTATDETTQLGSPRPTLNAMANVPPPSVPAPADSAAAPAGGMMSGLGRVVAEGFAFGVGSSIAHHAVGSMFGGSSGSSDSGAASPMDSSSSSGGDDDFDSDSWDI